MLEPLLDGLGRGVDHLLVFVELFGDRFLLILVEAGKLVIGLLLHNHLLHDLLGAQILAGCGWIFRGFGRTNREDHRDAC